MTNSKLIQKIEQLQEWERQIAEINKQLNEIKDEIKVEMEKKSTEKYEVGGYTIHYTSVVSNRFDSTTFKKSHPKLYEAFLKQSESKRFSIT